MFTLAMTQDKTKKDKKRQKNERENKMKHTITLIRPSKTHPSKPILKKPTLQVFKTVDGGLSFRDCDKRTAFLTKDDVKDVKKLLNRMLEF